MAGFWTKIPSLCSSKRTVAYRRCRDWADHGRAQCSSWADRGSYQCRTWADHGRYACSQWADHGSNQCSQWADEGSSHCCDWAPCSWFCDAFYWVAKWVCKGWYWVANLVCQAWYWVAQWVCQAWYWVANLVCQAWYWIAQWVCIAWEWIIHIFCSGNGGPLFLLTDGSVLMNECASGYGTHRWWRLTPDAVGSYTGGTWNRAADSNIGRKYFASAIMADGRLVVCGGEYSDATGSNSNDDTSRSEIYDPVANTWTELTPPPGITQVGDAACCLLPDGRFLLGNYNSTVTFLLDAAATSWTAGPAKGDSASEESWVLMPEGTVLAPQCNASPNAEKYDIVTNTWVPAGTLAPGIVETSSLEIGPGLLLPDKRAFFVGTNGNTALYTQGANSTAVGSWASGPALPAVNNQTGGSKDGPGALLVSGNVLFPIAPVDGVAANYLSPCNFYEFDGTSLQRVPDPANSNCPTYVGRMLPLPSGQVLWAREDDGDIYAYSIKESPQDSWRPEIENCPELLVPGTTIEITGRQFNGLSQANGYGDDYTAATNYPLVRILHLGTGILRYCRTFDHLIADDSGTTPSMGVATGETLIQTSVALPSDLETGASLLFVVANGIPSRAREVNVVRRGDKPFNQ